MDAGGAAGQRRAAVTGEVEREHPAGLGEFRPDGYPIDVRSTQPVHAYQQRTIGRTAEVEVVHRAVQIDKARHGAELVRLVGVLSRSDSRKHFLVGHNRMVFGRSLWTVHVVHSGPRLAPSSGRQAAP